MNIIGYAKKYGKYSFADNRFTDVDALIFAELSYINFELFFKEGMTSLKLSELTDDDFKNKAAFQDSVDARPNKKLLKILSSSVRYKDVIVQDIVNKYSHEEENQFYVLTFVLPNNNIYISYRGTDTTLIGWKEDFLLSVYDKIKAQIQAERYAIKELDKFEARRFYLGGHSKGGNLAFYAALNLPDDLAYRLIGSYSFDGPGFKQGIEGFKSYERVKHKLIKFRTFNNVIGSLFTDVSNYKVVYSMGILGGHDAFGWNIVSKSGFFRFARDVSFASKTLNNKFMLWLDSLSIQERMLAVEAFFRIFDKNETIYDLFRNIWRNLFVAKRSLGVYTNEERQSLKQTFKNLFGFMFNEKKMRKLKKKDIKKDQKLLEAGDENQNE